MSLGNVSYSYANEQYFRQTVVFLRRATQVPNYRLSPHMQKYVFIVKLSDTIEFPTHECFLTWNSYLNDYGRFVP